MSKWSEHGNCGGILPEELVIDILTRLPVKSLVRFKCVSRRWIDLIKSPCFISKHLNRMKNDDSKSSYRNYSCCGVVVTTKEDWLGLVREDIPKCPYGFLKLNLGPSIPYKPSYGDGGGTVPYSITGYCDGIFCLSWNHLLRFYYMYDGHHMLECRHIVISLCNPAIRELRILPLSGTDFPPYKRHYRVEIGFGFDPKTNDYKVVKIVMLPNEQSEAVDFIEVYSMKSDSWRMIVTRGSDDYAVAQNLQACAFGEGICTSKGALHWTMGNRVRRVIASFHMEDDSLRMTKLPSKYASFDRSKKHYLSLLYDKLALICNYKAEGNFIRVEIFLLNNYDDDDDSSWSLVTIMESFPHYNSTLGFWLESFLLVFDEKEKDPLLYDIVTKQFMELHQVTAQRGFFYKESFVSVKRGGREEECYSAVSPRDFDCSMSQLILSSEDFDPSSSEDFDPSSSEDFDPLS